MIDRILARPLLVVLAALAVTVALGAAASRIGFDNTPEQWLPSDVQGMDELAVFRERFGDDSLILAFTRDAHIDRREWRWEFARLADDLREVDGVASVQAPERAVTPDEPPLDNGSTAGLLASPLEPHLIGPDGHHVALAVFLERGLAPAERSALVTEIEAVLDEADPRVGPLDLAGADVITHDLDAGTARSLGGLAPVVLVAMCWIFWWATRSARAVGAMLLAAVAAGACALGLMALADRSLNLVIVVMPAILAVITAAYATHVVTRYLALPPRPDAADTAARRAGWAQAMRETWRPTLLSAVTTAAGFAALGTSEIPPIRDMGLFTAAGVLVAFVLTFTLVPALLVMSRRVVPLPHAARLWTPARAAGATAWLQRHRVAILVAAAALTAAGAWGVTRLQVESHILSFFPADHRVPRNYHEIEDTLVGLTPFELILEGPRERVLSGETLGALDALLQQAFAEEPLLLQTLSPFASEKPQAVPAAVRASFLDATLPPSRQLLPEAARRYLWMDPGGERLALRVTLTSKTGSSNEVDALIHRLRDRLEGRFPPEVHSKITGGPTLLIRGQVLLLDTQIRSFALAFAIVGLVIAVAFRSLTVLLISFLPNILPIVLTLGAMGLLQIPLNTATVTVAGIALGLIVDDTIHFLHRYNDARTRGESPTEAVRDTLYTIGRPVVVTSLAVAVGFGAFALSPFPPTRYFGGLIAWTSVAAVVCDLVVLPGVLLVGRSQREVPARA